MKMKMKVLAASIAAMLSGAGLVLAANPYTQKTYDNQLLLKALAAVAATADGTLVVDIGNGLADMYMVVDVTAITNTADNSFRIILEGSPDATFGTAANIVTVAELILGGTTGAAPMGAADVVGRFAVGCRNERNGVTYRYLRIRTVVAGTAAPSITYLAFLAKH